jgi:hypothetical protein
MHSIKFVGDKSSIDLPDGWVSLNLDDYATTLDIASSIVDFVDDNQHAAGVVISCRNIGVAAAVALWVSKYFELTFNIKDFGLIDENTYSKLCAVRAGYWAGN